MLSQQTIFVDREDKNSGAKAAEMIVRCGCCGCIALAYATRARKSHECAPDDFVICPCAPRAQNAIARDDRWPHIVIYPEGNTCNGRQMCAFKARSSFR